MSEVLASGLEVLQSIYMDGSDLTLFLSAIGLATIASTVLARWRVTKRVNVPVQADKWTPPSPSSKRKRRRA